MDHNKLRQLYLDFFTSRGHTIIPSYPLVPVADPTTLFTSSGMQPLIPYLLGQKHPQGQRLVNSQLCFRAEDIQEIGDNRHTTFFEMLGNWSLGDPNSPDGIGLNGYFKEDQLAWIFEFLTKSIGLDPNKLYVTVFSGDKATDIPKDTESSRIWKELFAGQDIEAKEIDLGTEENAARVGMQSGRIFYYGVNKNWWSRSGVPANMPVGEPGGPDSEIFYEFTNIEHDPKFGQNCHPNCDCGRFMEMCNSVFMQYQKQQDGSFALLKQKNVDFGGGITRMLAASNNDPDVFKIDSFSPLIAKLEEISKLNYADNLDSFRIIADHCTAAVFMTSESLAPSNKQQGYILRRLIRRSIVKAHQLGVEENFVSVLTTIIINIYAKPYPNLLNQKENIETILSAEENKFRKTLAHGLRKFYQLIEVNHQSITGLDLFDLYQTYGFPFELSQEIAQQKKITFDKKIEMDFDAEIKKHQQLSRTTSAGMFKGGLADHTQQTTRLHTAHHLLLASLRLELSDKIVQRGSNITDERLRIDINYPDKIPDSTLKKIEDWVNKAIAKNLTVIKENMSLSQALVNGALGEFGARYPDIVSVYTIKDDTNGEVYSKEICGGPHVQSTNELGQFKIIKEESSGLGTRRIKATLSS